MRVGATVSYLLSDQLGSTTVTTDASGARVAETRYKAWGQERYSWQAEGMTPSKYTYTGQYSNVSDFGLMFYNARWYDPALGRFTSADTIVPGGVQGLDRYAYVLNSPIAHTDPSGHDTCDEDGNCYNNNRRTWYQQPGAAKWNFTRLIRSGYSGWEAGILTELDTSGGQNAHHGVDFIATHGIRIVAATGWQSAGGSRGAWYSGDHLIVLNTEQGYSTAARPNEWGLSLVIHEAKHIEQGAAAWSKLGEMEGWQVGIDVAETLGWYGRVGWNDRDYSVKQDETIRDFADDVQEYDPGYWNVLTQWLPSEITNQVCVGLCSLPNWPVGWRD